MMNDPTHVSDTEECVYENQHEDMRVSRPGYLLHIISFGHVNGPLKYESTGQVILFSVRDIPNPPIKLRKTHTGLSARLRKEVVALKEAQTKLAEMIDEVQAAMTTAEQEAGGPPELPETDTTTSEWRPPKTLVVGIMCEEGKHRSVSFAIELSRHLKRKNWDFSVHHRDLSVSAKVNDEANGNDVTRLPKASRRSQTKKQRDQERRNGRSGNKGFIEHQDG
jgi:RNase adaptor protein for sRNA GlmZ degradation